MDTQVIGNYFHILLVILSAPIIRGYLMMITSNQKYILNEGDTVVLLCDFHAQDFNLFDYPVLWWKQQQHEKLQLNIMGNLNEPFRTTGRFQVNFSNEPPLYRLELIIREVTREDSGNYTCEVRGPSSSVLSYVTHIVGIRAPIEYLYISIGNHSEDVAVYDSSQYTRRVTMIAKQSTSIRCTSVGGFPDPQLTMRLDERDISYLFHQTLTSEMTGRPGIRLITYTSQLSTDRFTPQIQDDISKLKCVASVTGIRSNTTTINLSVESAPTIQCDDLHVNMWERNVMLRCDVWSKPQVKSLFWLLDDDGTSLSEGETLDGFWMVVQQVDASHLEVQLYIRQVTENNFRTYTLVVENNIASVRKSSNINRKEKPTPSSRPLKHNKKQNTNTQYEQIAGVNNAATNCLSQRYYLFIVVYLYISTL